MVLRVRSIFFRSIGTPRKMFLARSPRWQGGEARRRRAHRRTRSRAEWLHAWRNRKAVALLLPWLAKQFHIRRIILVAIERNRRGLFWSTRLGTRKRGLAAGLIRCAAAHFLLRAYIGNPECPPLPGLSELPTVPFSRLGASEQSEPLVSRACNASRIAQFFAFVAHSLFDAHNPF